MKEFTYQLHVSYKLLFILQYLCATHSKTMNSKHIDNISVFPRYLTTEKTNNKLKGHVTCPFWIYDM